MKKFQENRNTPPSTHGGTSLAGVPRKLIFKTGREMFLF